MVKRIVVGEFSTNCYLLALDDSRCVIIDPGAEGEKIEHEILALDLKPVMVICTHGHLDHIGAADYLIDTFSTDSGLLPLAAAERDKKYFGHDAKELHRKTFLQIGLNDLMFESMYSTIPEPDILLKPGDTIEGTDLTVLPTPGHTPGSISLLSRNHNMIFTGDCVMANGTGRTDLPGGCFENQEDSIFNIILKQKGSLKLMPGHGQSTTIERFSVNFHVV